MNYWRLELKHRCYVEKEKGNTFVILVLKAKIWISFYYIQIAIDALGLFIPMSLVLPPFYKWRNWESDTSGNSHRLVSGRIGHQIQGSLTRDSTIWNVKLQSKVCYVVSFRFTRTSFYTSVDIYQGLRKLDLNAFILVHIWENQSFFGSLYG